MDDLEVVAARQRPHPPRPSAWMPLALIRSFMFDQTPFTKGVARLASCHSVSPQPIIAPLAVDTPLRLPYTLREEKRFPNVPPKPAHAEVSS